MIAVAVVMAPSTLACSGSSPGRATPAGESIQIPAATIEQLDDGEHAFQLSILSGDRLTRGAYDRLASAYTQCIAEAGAALSDESMVDVAGNYFFVVQWPIGTEAAVGRCDREYWQPLGPLWSLSHSPTREQIQAGNDALGQCLRSAGVDFPSEHPSRSDFRQLDDAQGHPRGQFLQCVERVSKQLKLPGFAGG